MRAAAFALLLLTSLSTGQKTHVREYTRKDGTVVHAHDRATGGATPAPAQHSTLSPATVGSSTHSYPPGCANCDPAEAPRQAEAVPETPRPKPATMDFSRNPNPDRGDVKRTEAGKIERSSAAKHAFQHQKPCPANGRVTGPCPGYVIDHRKALACGGADAPSNMQWQTTAEAKAKDKWERAGCTTSK